MAKCPKCGRFHSLLALSRVDNEKMICDECRMKEAIASIPKEQQNIQDSTTLLKKGNHIK